MQTGSQPDAGEPALVTALIAPLVKLRAGLGDGTRPDDTGLSAMSALPGTVRASDDVHRGGLTPLADTETAAAAVPVIKKTNTEVAALGDVAPAFAPLLSSAYGVRDKAATALDTLISDFRTQATPLVNSARSQADLDAVVTLAADHLQSGVGVVKAADGEMDALTSQLKQDQPKVTTPGQPGLATPATGQPGLVQAADDQQQEPGTGTGSQYPNRGTAQPNPSTSQPQTGTNPQNSNYNGYTGSGTGGDVASQLAQSNPQLAAQLAIQTALLSTASTLGAALITSVTTLGTSLIEKGAQVITTGIEKGEAYAEKALAASTSQQTGATPGTTGQPAVTAPGAGTPNLTPGLADPTPSTAQPASGTPQPAATTPDTSVQPPATQPQAGQPQAGAPDNGGLVVPPIQGKPQPDNDTKPRRDGQQGVIPAPTGTT